MIFGAYTQTFFLILVYQQPMSRTKRGRQSPRQRRSRSRNRSSRTKRHHARRYRSTQPVTIPVSIRQADNTLTNVDIRFENPVLFCNTNESPNVITIIADTAGNARLRVSGPNNTIHYLDANGTEYTIHKPDVLRRLRELFPDLLKYTPSAAQIEVVALRRQIYYHQSLVDKYTRTINEYETRTAENEYTAIPFQGGAIREKISEDQVRREMREKKEREKLGVDYVSRLGDS